MEETQCLISKDAKGIFLFLIIVQIEIVILIKVYLHTKIQNNQYVLNMFYIA